MNCASGPPALLSHFTEEQFDWLLKQRVWKNESNNPSSFLLGQRRPNLCKEIQGRHPFFAGTRKRVLWLTWYRKDARIFQSSWRLRETSGKASVHSLEPAELAQRRQLQVSSDRIWHESDAEHPLKRMVDIYPRLNDVHQRVPNKIHAVWSCVKIKPGDRGLYIYQGSILDTYF